MNWRACSLKKINKIKKHLARLIKQKRERPKSEMKKELFQLTPQKYKGS